jgi:hypothetical protein
MTLMAPSTSLTEAVYQRVMMMSLMSTARLSAVMMASIMMVTGSSIGLLTMAVVDQVTLVSKGVI